MTTLAFVANGHAGSAASERARAFIARLPRDIAASVHDRTGGRASSFHHQLLGLRRARPRVVYVIDLGVAGIAAAFAYRRLSGCRVVVETGDAVADLLFSTGRVGRAGRRCVAAYEDRVLRAADRVVVRGSAHREHLAARGVRVAAVIPDGVDTDVFRPFDVRELRASLGFQDHELVVGVLGSLHWSARLQWTSGLEVVDALSRVRTHVRGLIIGDGSGRPRLEAAARDRGLAARIRFEPWMPLDALPAYVNCMDACVSTQTNDVVGQVRTTGKLPLYLACGRFVLASNVGEAARVLPAEMLVEYAPGFDAAYGTRLAERIERLCREPHLLALGKDSREIAEREFAYDRLVFRVLDVVTARW